MSVLTEFMGGIADAIRDKTETTEKIPAADFAENIRKIEVMPKKLGTATPNKVVQGTTFSSDSGIAQTGTFAPEEKTIIPTKEQQIVTPMAGKFLSKVTVEPSEMTKYRIVDKPVYTTDEGTLTPIRVNKYGNTFTYATVSTNKTKQTLYKNGANKLIWTYENVAFPKSHGEYIYMLTTSGSIVVINPRDDEDVKMEYEQSNDLVKRYEISQLVPFGDYYDFHVLEDGLFLFISYKMAVFANYVLHLLKVDASGNITKLCEIKIPEEKNEYIKFTVKISDDSIYIRQENDMFSRYSFSGQLIFSISLSDISAYGVFEECDNDGNSYFVNATYDSVCTFISILDQNGVMIKKLNLPFISASGAPIELKKHNRKLLIDGGKIVGIVDKNFNIQCIGFNQGTTLPVLRGTHNKGIYHVCGRNQGSYSNFSFTYQEEV